jgi:hypothetical protein
MYYVYPGAGSNTGGGAMELKKQEKIFLIICMQGD